MTLDHHTVRSPLFELRSTHEVDLEFGDDAFPTRVEILRSTVDPTIYRARIWQLEPYRIQSTFPQDDGRPAHDPSDEELLIERSCFAKPDLSTFKADSDEDALDRALAALHQWLVNAFGDARSGSE